MDFHQFQAISQGAIHNMAVYSEKTNAWVVH
jgi:hypothetical protein